MYSKKFRYIIKFLTMKSTLSFRKVEKHCINRKTTLYR
uniref:Uncharacterized protein n=1 Tax=Anguilla anguilla TaxID=7936 RepID=A0A0E9S9D1_ANGAN